MKEGTVRLQDYTFVDMIAQMEKEEKTIKNSKEKIKQIYQIYGMSTAGYKARKKRILKNTTLEALITKYKNV